MKMNRKNVTAGARSSGGLMVVTLVLMVLSCVLFVGTTLAWFTNQISGGVHRIQAGNLEAVLMIGESRYTAMRLETESDTPQGGTGNAVQLCLHKLLPTKDEEGRVTDVAVSDNKEEIWNPDDIFISDVMQVKKAVGSIPFEYRLELLIDPEPEDADQGATTNGDENGETAPEPLKASDLIDFRIVDVDTISTLSTDDPTRTYQYDAITDYFPEELTEPDEGLIWSSTLGWDGGSGQTPTNVFPSEPAEGQKPVCFVILARLNPNVSVDTNSTDTIENPFNLVVTITQQLAAKAGGAP